MSVCLCFLFNQKTAYEMRISDWSSDVCSSDLLAEAEHTDDAHRIGEIHERLNAIDAHAAPARAARILVGLGFDEDMQHRALDSFSGGWRMRVALAELGRASCRGSGYQFV